MRHASRSARRRRARDASTPLHEPVERPRRPRRILCSRPVSSSARCWCCGLENGTRLPLSYAVSWCSRRRSTRRSTRQSSSAPRCISAVLRQSTRSSGWRIRIIIERIVVAAATFAAYDAVRAARPSRRDGCRVLLTLGAAAVAQIPVDLASAVAPAAPADVLAAGAPGLARDRVVGNAHGDRLPRCRRSTARSASGVRLLFSTPLLAAWYAFERLDSATRCVPADDRSAGDGARARRHRAPRSLATSGGAVVGDGGRAGRLGQGHVGPRDGRAVAPPRPGHDRRARGQRARRRRRKSRPSPARCCARSSRSPARATSLPATRTIRAAASRCRCCGSRATTTTSPPATATRRAWRSRRCAPRRATCTTTRCSPRSSASSTRAGSSPPAISVQ